jgi:hypothetical protein
MRREPVAGPMARWQPWRWVLADVLPAAEPMVLASGSPPLVPGPAREVAPVEDSPSGADASHWLYPGFRVELFRDDAEGYFLNLTSPQPCFWVVWRPSDEQMLAGEPMAIPQTVTLSYHDAGRWLDAQERVEQVAAPEPVVAWLRAFVDVHYQAEPKRRKRPDSFKPLTDRFGQPVRVSTDKRRGGPSASGHGR